MRSAVSRVRGITQFYLPPTRLSTNGMNHPAFTSYAFTRWHHTTHLSTPERWTAELA